MIPAVTYDRPVHKSQAIRKARGRAFVGLAILATSLGVVVLAVLLITVTKDGIGVLSFDFINSFPHYKAELAGVKSALAGTLWVMAVTALFAITFGVGAAIYLEEFASRNWFTKVVEININNLAVCRRWSTDCLAWRSSSTAWALALPYWRAVSLWRCSSCPS